MQARRSFGDRTWVALEDGTLLLFVPESMQGAAARSVHSGQVLGVLERFLRPGGFRNAPEFVLVERRGDEALLILRGRVRAASRDAEGKPVRVEGGEFITWAERIVHGDIVLVALDEHGDELPDELHVPLVADEASVGGRASASSSGRSEPGVSESGGVVSGESVSDVPESGALASEGDAAESGGPGSSGVSGSTASGGTERTSGQGEADGESSGDGADADAGAQGAQRGRRRTRTAKSPGKRSARSAREQARAGKSAGEDSAADAEAGGGTPPGPDPEDAVTSLIVDAHPGAADAPGVKGSRRRRATADRDELAAEAVAEGTAAQKRIGKIDAAQSLVSGASGSAAPEPPENLAGEGADAEGAGEPAAAAAELAEGSEAVSLSSDEMGEAADAGGSAGHSGADTVAGHASGQNTAADGDTSGGADLLDAAPGDEAPDEARRGVPGDAPDRAATARAAEDAATGDIASGGSARGADHAVPGLDEAEAAEGDADVGAGEGVVRFVSGVEVEALAEGTGEGEDAADPAAAAVAAAEATADAEPPAAARVRDAAPDEAAQDVAARGTGQEVSADARTAAPAAGEAGAPVAPGASGSVPGDAGSAGDAEEAGENAWRSGADAAVGKALTGDAVSGSFAEGHGDGPGVREALAATEPGDAVRAAGSSGRPGAEEGTAAPVRAGDIAEDAPLAQHAAEEAPGEDALPEEAGSAAAVPAGAPGDGTSGAFRTDKSSDGVVRGSGLDPARGGTAVPDAARGNGKRSGSVAAIRSVGDDAERETGDAASGPVTSGIVEDGDVAAGDEQEASSAADDAFPEDEGEPLALPVPPGGFGGDTGGAEHAGGSSVRSSTDGAAADTLAEGAIAAAPAGGAAGVAAEEPVAEGSTGGAADAGAPVGDAVTEARSDGAAVAGHAAEGSGAGIAAPSEAMDATRAGSGGAEVQGAVPGSRKADELAGGSVASETSAAEAIGRGALNRAEGIPGELEAGAVSPERLAHEGAEGGDDPRAVASGSAAPGRADDAAGARDGDEGGEGSAAGADGHAAVVDAAPGDEQPDASGKTGFPGGDAGEPGTSSAFAVEPIEFALPGSERDADPEGAPDDAGASADPAAQAIAGGAEMDHAAAKEPAIGAGGAPADRTADADAAVKTSEPPASGYDVLEITASSPSGRRAEHEPDGEANATRRERDADELPDAESPAPTRQRDTRQAAHAGKEPPLRTDRPDGRHAAPIIGMPPRAPRAADADEHRTSREQPMSRRALRRQQTQRNIDARRKAPGSDFFPVQTQESEIRNVMRSFGSDDGQIETRLVEIGASGAAHATDAADATRDDPAQAARAGGDEVPRGEPVGASPEARAVRERQAAPASPQGNPELGVMDVTDVLTEAGAAVPPASTGGDADAVAPGPDASDAAAVGERALPREHPGSDADGSAPDAAEASRAAGAPSAAAPLPADLPDGASRADDVTADAPGFSGGGAPSRLTSGERGLPGPEVSADAGVAASDGAVTAAEAIAGADAGSGESTDAIARADAVVPAGADEETFADPDPAVSVDAPTDADAGAEVAAVAETDAGGAAVGAPPAPRGKSGSGRRARTAAAGSLPPGARADYPRAHGHDADAIDGLRAVGTDGAADARSAGAPRAGDEVASADGAGAADARVMDARATGAADPAGVSAMGVRAADAADARVTDAGAVGASGAADEGGAAGAAAVHDAGAEEPFAPGDDLPDETTFSRWSSAARRAVRLSAASAELGGLTEAPADAIDMTLKGGIAKILREAARRGTTEGAPSRTSAIKGAQPTAPMQPADFVEMFGGAPKPRSEHGRSAAAARSAEGSEQEAAELAAERAAENWAAPLGSHAPEALATLEFAGGDSVPVRVPIIIGRSPNQGPQRPGEPHPQWVKVVGSTDISRNHARVEVSAGLVLVTDLHSRNGTDIILPDRPAERLRPGEPTVVVSGTVIDLGSGVAFTVRS